MFNIPKILWTSYVHGPLGDGPAASMDGPAAARMMLLHPNRMAASKEEETAGGSSSQVRAQSMAALVLTRISRNIATVDQV